MHKDKYAGKCFACFVEFVIMCVAYLVLVLDANFNGVTAGIYVLPCCVKSAKYVFMVDDIYLDDPAAEKRVWSLEFLSLLISTMVCIGITSWSYRGFLSESVLTVMETILKLGMLIYPVNLMVWIFIYMWLMKKGTV